ncbi:pyridoxal-phosphate-dependent aminotransferase family protein [Thalassobacillus hwangdonensis]|uniref:Pyridoxal-phosphate-dependent aminotransferase family protein n=1 Tax=Thalassobacillus hwangdonensis TaxID=546108 RepID=A0ABW3L2T8_9BACI
MGHLLRIPGPTPIPPQVTQAMAQPMIGHRSQACKDLIKKITPKLNRVFGSASDVLVLTGSGTSALEAAVVNMTDPGDEVLVVVTGAFGGRFASIAEAYGLQVHCHDIEWGKAADPSHVQDHLKQHPGIKTVFLTHCETSTGVLNPVSEIAKTIRKVSDALVVVDGVSSVGGAEISLDKDGIDLLVSGSQKALMLPPGLAFVAVSERARKVIEHVQRPRFYLDLRKYCGNWNDGQTPFTPALSLLMGLDEVLDMQLEEGIDAIFQRHLIMRDMTRAAMKALEIPLLTNEVDASTTVTSVKPTAFDAEAFRKTVHESFGLLLAGGQQHLKGEIFRIGHMGYCTPEDILETIKRMEAGLKKMGVPFESGAGLEAAERKWKEAMHA